MNSPSNSQVDKAGAILRRWLADPNAEPTAQELGAFSMVDAFRRTFQKPLQKTTVGLRQFVDRESTTVIVGQRLKRTPRIVLKLHRFPTLSDNLS